MLVGGKKIFAGHGHDPAGGRQIWQLGHAENKKQQRGPGDALCSVESDVLATILG